MGGSVEDEIWYGAPTFKQAKHVFWRRLKQTVLARGTAEIGCLTSTRTMSRGDPLKNRLEDSS